MNPDLFDILNERKSRRIAQLERALASALRSCDVAEARLAEMTDRIAQLEAEVAAGTPPLKPGGVPIGGMTLAALMQADEVHYGGYRFVQDDQDDE